MSNRTGKPRAKLPTLEKVDVKVAFLAALVTNGGNVTDSARAANVSRRTIYDWLRDDGDFRAEYDEAMEMARDALRAEIHRRAVLGYDEPQFQQGHKVGVVRKYSDRLLELLARAHLPEHREQLDITTNGQAIQGPNLYTLVLTDPKVAELATALAERLGLPEPAEDIVIDAGWASPAE